MSCSTSDRWLWEGSWQGLDDENPGSLCAGSLLFNLANVHQLLTLGKYTENPSQIKMYVRITIFGIPIYRGYSYRVIFSQNKSRIKWEYSGEPATYLSFHSELHPMNFIQDWAIYWAKLMKRLLNGVSAWLWNVVKLRRVDTWVDKVTLPTGIPQTNEYGLIRHVFFLQRRKLN